MGIALRHLRAGMRQQLLQSIQIHLTTGGKAAGKIMPQSMQGAKVFGQSGNPLHTAGNATVIRPLFSVLSGEDKRACMILNGFQHSTGGCRHGNMFGFSFFGGFTAQGDNATVKITVIPA